mmetsp:Transcript_23019/g.51342  ORF Transcript_23019/g.51342 Transcript_23019/m.51342 type:complete len:533 (-) Transcript_23019:61-1659(-)
MIAISAPPPLVTAAEVALGLGVDVESRTWPGINKPGGCGSIVKIHYDDSNHPAKVDVKYHLGGTDKEIELNFVRKHVELARGGRSRRRDVKMNVEILGGKPAKQKKTAKNSESKKRKALLDLDKNNHGKSPEVEDSASSAVVEEAPRTVQPSVVDVTDEIVANGLWRIIQSGKVADYTNILSEGRRIAYWWSDEDEWLKGIVSKPLTKKISPYTISWTVRVNFDNGDSHTLTFHPLEKRWKVFYPNSDRAEQSPSTRPEVTTKAKKVTKKEQQRKHRPPVQKPRHTTMAAVVGEAQKPPPQVQLSSAKQITDEELSTIAARSKEREEERRRMKSMMAPSAPHAAAKLSIAPKRHGFLSEKIGIARKSESLIDSPSSKIRPEAYRNEGTLKFASQTVTQALYKSEYAKADQFVDEMVTGSEVAIAKSPKEEPEELELKVNASRMNLFRKIYYEVISKRGIETVTVDELILKFNAYQEAQALLETYQASDSDSSCGTNKAFTLLETKSYLRQAHSANTIFFVEDEGQNGVVYSI